MNIPSCQNCFDYALRKNESDRVCNRQLLAFLFRKLGVGVCAFCSPTSTDLGSIGRARFTPLKNSPGKYSLLFLDFHPLSQAANPVAQVPLRHTFCDQFCLIVNALLEHVAE